MKTEKYTAEVFELLSKGQFICSNSTVERITFLYGVLDNEECFEELYAFFLQINFILEKGDQFFYFSRKEVKATLEQKIETAFKWIDILDFFKTFDQGFGTGFRFSPSEVEVRLDVDADLKTKLESLRKYAQKRTSYADIIRKVLDLLVRDNFIELQDELTSTYKVLSSVAYLEELVFKIAIPEELDYEVAQ